MLNRAPDFPSVPISDIEELATLWVRAGQRQCRSERTIQGRAEFTEKFLWFLRHRSLEAVGPEQIEDFVHYLRTGKTEPGGRWGNARMTKPLRPVSICDYYRSCRGFFRWSYRKGFIDATPMDRVEAPRAPSEVKPALTHEEVELLLGAARRSSFPLRDTAVITLLYDSGVRASELLGLKVGDIDLKRGRFQVLGKGNKVRPVFVEQEASEALLLYRRKLNRGAEEPLFVAESGPNMRKALTRSGLLQLVKRLAKAAGIECNVHQLRRTFATHSRINGASLEGIRDMLGHTSIKMTLVYCSLAEADIERQHRQCSPADRLRRRDG
jgi:integrase/recombinase XerD